MSQAKPGDTVSVHYTGKLDDGTQFDSSVGKDPLEFEIGRGGVIPGFEKAVEGMIVGDSKSVRIEPHDAYGPRHDQLVQEGPRSNLPENLTPEANQMLEDTISIVSDLIPRIGQLEADAVRAREKLTPQIHDGVRALKMQNAYSSNSRS